MSDKKEFYTEEDPSGPWSRALRDIRKKAERDEGIQTRIWKRLKEL